MLNTGPAVLVHPGNYAIILPAGSDSARV